jgi:exopolyphosphatase/guanosine-5'-triphosphate,3'-diphosphate pyrophosphatase
MTTPQHPTQRIAAVDIGSNTIHLVIVDTNAVRDLTILDRQVDLARLGADVTKFGQIGEERAARAVATLRTFAALSRGQGATLRLAVATEGVRAARNAEEMLARFSAAWGAPITLVTGVEEAVLTFWGATSTERDPAHRVGVADLGGGSCEVVVGTIEKLEYATSVPIGSSKLVELAHIADPPSLEDMSAVRTAAYTRVILLPRPKPRLDDVIAVGGSATAMARFAGKSEGIQVPDISNAVTLLMSASSKKLAAQTGVDAERIKILPGGMAAWQAVMERLGSRTLRVSERGVREGVIVAWQLAGDGWLDLVRATIPPAPEYDFD